MDCKTGENVAIYKKKKSKQCSDLLTPSYAQSEWHSPCKSMSPRKKSLDTSAEFFFFSKFTLKTYGPKRFMFEYKDLHFSAWFLKLITCRRGFTQRTLKMHVPYILPPAAVPNVPPCFKLMSLSYICCHGAEARHSAVDWSCMFFLCGQSISAALHKPP